MNRDHMLGQPNIAMWLDEPYAGNKPGFTPRRVPAEVIVGAKDIDPAKLVKRRGSLVVNSPVAKQVTSPARQSDTDAIDLYHGFKVGERVRVVANYGGSWSGKGGVITHPPEGRGPTTRATFVWFKLSEPVAGREVGDVVGFYPHQIEEY